MTRYPFCRQPDTMDCGAACLKMICSYYGKEYSIETVRSKCDISREGSSLLGISGAAEQLGLKSVGIKTSIDSLLEAPMPFIVHWRQRHFVVVYNIKIRKLFWSAYKDDQKHHLKGTVIVADPETGIIKYNIEEFLEGWIGDRNNNEDKGIALLLETTPLFYQNGDEKKEKLNFSFLIQYIRPYRKLIVQLFIGLFVGSLLQLVFPFLTQSIVDYGIGNNSLDFIILILIAQLTLHIAQTAIEFIRSWILLHISTRINIALISDFLIKLMKLPISFFDTKNIGDIMQRIDDHNRIRNFITTTALNTLFSFFTLLVFTIVLSFYSFKLLFIFLVISSVHVSWIIIFLNKRKKIDHQRFTASSSEQNQLLQMINGMQEIKLNGCERQKRWEWEHVQARLFKISIDSLALSQYQQSGAFFINEIKNILLTFFSAKAVIDGEITIGSMLAISYILGHLNAPIMQLIQFSQSAQDAKISIDRLSEIHQKDNEENNNYTVFLPEGCDNITVSNLSFRYPGQLKPVLNNINLRIPKDKVTAIVGVSGSGKTTLLKLLLGFYPDYRGKILVGDKPLSIISPHTWRMTCGAVMQDGYIFSDTIAKNIAPADEIVDKERLLSAARLANIMDMVEQQPLGFNTMIGSEGKGISQGQRQRILIARSIYKNAPFLFFDEATNSLDANNEKVILDNLTSVFKGKTVVIVAHRLSTVRSADNIVVLDEGTIVEQGTHGELIKTHGKYYELVKNQLELGI